MFKNLLKMNWKYLEVVFFAGTAVGAVVGSVAGVGIGFALGNLFAPKSGEDLRHDLSERTNELADAVKEKSKALKEKTTKMYSSMAENGVES